MGKAGGAGLCLLLGWACILLEIGAVGASREQMDPDVALQDLIDQQTGLLIPSDPALYTPLLLHNGTLGMQPRSSQQTPQTRSTYVDVLHQMYGRWCGAGHGGYTDCCNGRPCPACANELIADRQLVTSPECLAQCPPQDAMDQACASHDTCFGWPPVLARSAANDAESTCNGLFELGSHYCGCDAALVASVQRIDPATLPFQWGAGTAFRAGLLLAFGLYPCWSYSASGLPAPQCFGSNKADPSLWIETPVLSRVTAAGTTCYVSSSCLGACSAQPGTACVESRAACSIGSFTYSCQFPAPPPALPSGCDCRMQAVNESYSCPYACQVPCNPPSHSVVSTYSCSGGPQTCYQNSGCNNGASCSAGCSLCLFCSLMGCKCANDGTCSKETIVNDTCASTCPRTCSRTVQRQICGTCAPPLPTRRPPPGLPPPSPVPPPPPAAPEPPLPPGTTTGCPPFSSSDLAVPLETVATPRGSVRVFMYCFLNITLGQTLSAGTCSGAACSGSAYLVLRSPNGSVVAQNGAACGACAALAARAATSSGLFTLSMGCLGAGSCGAGVAVRMSKPSAPPPLPLAPRPPSLPPPKPAPKPPPPPAKPKPSPKPPLPPSPLLSPKPPPLPRLKPPPPPPYSQIKNAAMVGGKGGEP